MAAIGASLLAIEALLLTACAAPSELEAAEPPAKPAERPAASEVEAEPQGFDGRLDELRTHEWVVGYLQPAELRFGPRTVAFDEDGVSTTVLGAESEMPGVVTPPNDPDREINGRSIGVQQDASFDSALIAASLERKRSSGLQAGASVFVARSYDDSGTMTHEVEVPGPERGYMGSTSLFGGVAVLDAHDEDTDQDLYLAIDLEMGELLWQRACDGRFYANDSVIGADGTYVIKCGQNYQGLGLRDGAVKWERSTAEHSDRDVMRLPSTGDFFTWYGEDGIFDAATGEQRVPGPLGEMVFDPVTGLLSAIVGTRTENGMSTPGGLHVIDLDTGEIVFEVPAAELERLGEVELLGTFDQRLWFWGGDGLDIVDIRTGAQDPLAPARTDEPGGARNIPLAAGETWVLIGDVDPYSGLSVTGIYRDPAGGIELADIPQTTR
ncbi:hypothetical protein [Leucobacter sp. GX0328]